MMTFHSLLAGISLSLYAWTSEAYPNLWRECALPQTAEGGHKTPETDEAIGFQFFSSDGSVISSFVPGVTYTVEVTPTAASRGIILASGGQFDGQVVSCNGARSDWRTLKEKHSVRWTAPAAGGDVTFDVNFASGSSAPFKQSSVSVPLLGGGAEGLESGVTSPAGGSAGVIVDDASRGLPGTEIYAPAGSYTPTTNVEAEVNVSRTVGEVVAAMKADNITVAEEIYLANDYLTSLAKGEGLSGPVFEKFAAHFGGADFNHRVLMEAFGMSDAGARFELVEKTMADAVPAQAILSYVHAGVGGDASAWDKAAGLYLGDGEISPYQQAVSRATDFGTEVDYEGRRVARANREIMQALIDKAADADDVVLSNLLVVYTQCTLRYARSVDVDLETGSGELNAHRAEGLAFYNILAPYVSEKDPDCDTELVNMFNISSPLSADVQNYCVALRCLTPALELSPQELGAYAEAVDVCGRGFPYQRIYAPAGSYTPTTDVKTEVNVSRTVGEVVAAMEADNITVAEAIYLSNDYLTSLAKGEGLSGPEFDKFAAHFGGADFNHRVLTEAFGMSDAGARFELVEKTMADAVPAQAILSYVYAGVGGNASAWDKAAGLYLGDGEISPYQQAVFRATDFGTEVEYEGRTVARANREIMQALIDKADDAGEVVRRNLLVVYTQCTLRYARSVDVDLETGSDELNAHRAEGLAFYNILAPYVSAEDPNCDTELNNMFDIAQPISSDVQHYCVALRCIPPTLNINSTELGTYAEVAETVCLTSPTMTPEGSSTTSPPEDSMANVLSTTFLCVMAVIVHFLQN